VILATNYQDDDTTSNYRYCDSVTGILEITRTDASMQVRPAVDCLCEEVKRNVTKHVDDVV